MTKLQKPTPPLPEDRIIDFTEVSPRSRAHLSSALSHINSVRDAADLPSALRGELDVIRHALVRLEWKARGIDPDAIGQVPEAQQEAIRRHFATADDAEWQKQEESREALERKGFTVITKDMVKR